MQHIKSSIIWLNILLQMLYFLPIKRIVPLTTIQYWSAKWTGKKSYMNYTHEGTINNSKGGLIYLAQIWNKASQRLQQGNFIAKKKWPDIAKTNTGKNEVGLFFLHNV